MIDVTRHTTKSTRLRKVKKVKETHNGDVSKLQNVTNGATHLIEDTNDVDGSWNVMNYTDYRRRRSGGSNCSFDTSKVSSPTSTKDGRDSAGFIFRYYRKFGFYWNVFPKTDYCYLPSSPDYHKEISPGIPKVPNLSRPPLSYYIRRGISAQEHHEASSRLSESRFDVSEALASSSKLETSSNTLPASNWSSIAARQHLINSSLHRAKSRSSWTKIKRLTQTIVRVITRTVNTTVTHVSSSVVSSNQRQHGARNSRSCKLPLFLFLVFLLPLLFYFIIPGLTVAFERSEDDEITAVSNKASNMLFWYSDIVTSGVNLVKGALLYIPTLFMQLAALFQSNSTIPSPKSDASCIDSPPGGISSAPFFPEIIEKLKSELAGRDHHLTSRIEQIQLQMTQLNEDVKKMSNQFEDEDWKNNLQKLEVELSGLKKAVIDVKDQAVCSVASPSQKMVELAVAKYHADRTGKPDYALQSSGGYIVRVRCAQTYTRTTANVYILGLPLPWDVFNGPETIIKPGVMPGECWAFEGSFAQVTLHLATKVKITSFSLEHSPRELALHGHISSAPKQFSVWALENENDENPFFLGRFTFLEAGDSLQEFEAIEYDQAVNLIDLKIESNHGHPEYTCLYRFRVHGVPPPV